MSDSYQKQEERHPRPGSVQVALSFRPSFPAGNTSSLLFILRGFDKDEVPSGELGELHMVKALAHIIQAGWRWDQGSGPSLTTCTQSTLPLTDLGKLFIRLVLPSLSL